ncbi:MAG TPA: DNA polymerase III subunit gamma/tau [Solirubrobacteraceae bacterium]|nr:DNA polymerase III subunit gamma/tau [Solirubrobacteraceae bacterium]
MPKQPQAEQQSSSLYRRHRPRTFAEVVGQEPVVRTLRNAVEREQVHHAYLFVGSRGTGKTSMAKILAACLNCERGPTVDPCGECSSCTAIARASSLDVIEMDAASNNSVDDIRELRESVAFAPVSGRRKVYILDEAHMLSTAAWNAFLKTLEEPPANTVFVLATTEAQKVPATVVDRCHRFDFQRPTVEQIARVLSRTAESESIEIPPEAIAALARSATGSFRDALGTLEQLLAYSGRTIALEDVLAVLGVADSQLLEQAVDAVAGGDARAALLALAECAEGGRDAGSFAADLQARARELLVAQTLGELPAELALTPEADARLLAQAGRVDHATVVRLLELLGEALESVRAGTDPRTSLELALVKAARPEVDSSTKALLARIERLEGGGRASATLAPAAPAPDPDAGVTGAFSRTAPEADEAGDVPQVPIAVARDAPAPQADGAGDAREPGIGLAHDARTPQADGAHEAPAPVAAGALEQDTPPVAAVTPAAGMADGAAMGPAPIAVGDVGEMVDLWPAVVELVSAGHGLCGAVIAGARPIAVSDRDLTVGFPVDAAFLKRQAEDPSNRATVTEALRELTGGRWRISYELREDLDLGEGAQPRKYTEEEWIERFKSELDAEEIPLDPDGSDPDLSQPDGSDPVLSRPDGSDPVLSHPGRSGPESDRDPDSGLDRNPDPEPVSLAGGEALAGERKEA